METMERIKKITVLLSSEEMDFITWLAKRDNISVSRELMRIFYTELNALMDLHEEEFKQEREAIE
jgi:hypothetical protein